MSPRLRSISTLPAAGGAIVVDHRCTDLGQVPPAAIAQAKATLRVGYGHTSHGSQLVTGLEAIRDHLGAPFDFTASGWGLDPGVFLNDSWGNAGGAADLGHGGDLAWRDATIAMLAAPGNDRNVVIWSWCGGVSDTSQAGIAAYLTAMDQLERSYPGVRFVYMTGHLDGSGSAGNLHARNQQIRTFCLANDKVLFDFADIESFDPAAAATTCGALRDRRLRVRRGRRRQPVGRPQLGRRLGSRPPAERACGVRLGVRGLRPLAPAQLRSQGARLLVAARPPRRVERAARAAAGAHPAPPPSPQPRQRVTGRIAVWLG